jgi:hypothetical protein
VKTPNILLVYQADGRLLVKLADVGIACPAAIQGTKLSMQGTCYYMGPEVMGVQPHHM